MLATCFSSLSDDEVGELQSAIRAERAKASEAINSVLAFTNAALRSWFARRDPATNLIMTQLQDWHQEDCLS